MNLKTVSAPDLPLFCVQISSLHQGEDNSKIPNIALINYKSQLYTFFCVYSKEIEDKIIYVNPDIILPENQVSLELIFVNPSQKVEKINFNPKFRFALIGLPIVPNSITYFSFHGRNNFYTNSSEKIGFISDKTEFVIDQKKELNEITELCIEKPISDRIVKMIYHRHSIVTKSLLIVGNSGSGKSYFIKKMVKNTNGCVKLDLLRFISEIEISKFDYIDSVLSIEDGVLLIDDVCTLTAQIASMLVEKLSILDEKPVIIIGTSREPPYNLPIPLQAQFPFALYISSLKQEERKKMLKSEVPDEYLEFAVRETSGNTLGELINLKKILPSLQPFSPVTFSRLLNSISTSEKPNQLRTTSEKVKIGGYHNELSEIRLFLRVSFSDNSSLLQYNGLLLTGPSGNGKSLIIRSISNEFEVPFFVIEFDKIFSRYLSESEKSIREVFKAARFFAPSAIVIEDIDAIGSKRNDDSGVGGRVLSTLLNELDGVDKKSKVIVIATTNAQEIVDPALLRPGRFDRIVQIGMPSEDDRREIFEILREKTPVDDDVKNEWLASITSNYTCAEIQSFFRFSALQALKEGKESVTKDYFILGQKRIEERKKSFQNLPKNKMML